MKLREPCALCGTVHEELIPLSPNDSPLSGLFFCLPPKNEIVYLCADCVAMVKELD